MNENTIYTEADIKCYGLIAMELLRYGYDLYERPIQECGALHLGFSHHNVLLALCLAPSGDSMFVGLGVFKINRQRSELFIEIRDRIPAPELIDMEELPESFVDELLLRIAYLNDAYLEEVGPAAFEDGEDDSDELAEDKLLWDLIMQLLTEQHCLTCYCHFDEGSSYLIGFAYHDRIYGINWRPRHDLICVGAFTESANGIGLDTYLLYARATLLDVEDGRHPLRNLSEMAGEIEELIKAEESDDFRPLTVADLEDE